MDFSFLSLIGGLAVFIFGMKLMSESLQQAAGSKFRHVLDVATRNRFGGVGAGLLSTIAVQSSSATTVMTVGLVNAQLLNLRQAVGVIMGANIGTTFTIWIVAFLGFDSDIEWISVPAMFLGVVLLFMRSPRLQNWGGAALGFGLLFLGLDVMKGSISVTDSADQSLLWLANLQDMGFGSVILFWLVGALLTVIIQSSSATSALTVTLVATGVIDFEMAVAMILGENLGTTITANIAAIPADRTSKKAAVAHTLFNIFGVIWAFALFYPIINVINTATDPITEYFVAEDEKVITPPTQEELGELTDPLRQWLGDIESATIITMSEEEIAALGDPFKAWLKAKDSSWNPYNNGDDAMSNLDKLVLLEELKAEKKAERARETEDRYKLAVFHTAFNVINMLLLIGFVGGLANSASWIVDGISKVFRRSVKSRILEVSGVEPKAAFISTGDVEIQILDVLTRDAVRKTRETFETIAQMIETGFNDLLASRVVQDDRELDEIRTGIMRQLRQIQAQGLAGDSAILLLTIHERDKALEAMGDSLVSFTRQLRRAHISGVVLRQKTRELMLGQTQIIRDQFNLFEATGITPDERANKSEVLRKMSRTLRRRVVRAIKRVKSPEQSLSLQRVLLVVRLCRQLDMVSDELDIMTREGREVPAQI